MADEPVTQQFIYQREADILIARHGKPIRKALRLALVGCVHPDNKRISVVKVFSSSPGEAINANVPTKQIAGFFCKKCRQYVFQD